MRPVATVVLVLVIVLSGCQSLGGGGQTVETVTPAPVPAPDRGPPGVDIERTTVASSVLLDTHEAALRNQSYRVEFRFRATPVSTESDATMVNQTAVIGLDRGHFYQSTQLSGPLFGISDTRREVYWANSTAAGAARFVDGRRVSRADLTFGRPPAVEQFDAYVRAVFRDVPVRTIEVDGNGNYRIVAQADSVPDDGLAVPFRNVSDVRATAIVTPTGIVEAMAVSYVGYQGSDRYQVRRTARVRSGNLSVPKPIWITGSNDASGEE